MTKIAPQYAVNKSKGSTGSEWEESIVAELNSSLNQWVDSIPDHRTSFLSPLA
jgi:hypothetical protein